MRAHHQSLFQLSIYRRSEAKWAPREVLLWENPRGALQCWTEDLYSNKERSDREAERSSFREGLARRTARRYISELLDLADRQITWDWRLEQAREIIWDTDGDSLRDSLAEIADKKPDLFGFLQLLTETQIAQHRERFQGLGAGAAHAILAHASQVARERRERQ